MKPNTNNYRLLVLEVQTELDSARGQLANLERGYERDHERVMALAAENHSLLCKFNAVCSAVDPDPTTWNDVGEVCAKIRRLREYAADTAKLREAIRPFRLP